MMEPPSLTEREIKDSIDKLLNQQQTLENARFCKPANNQCADHAMYREATIVNTAAGILAIRINEQILWEIKKLKGGAIKADDEVNVEMEPGFFKYKGRGLFAVVAFLTVLLAWGIKYLVK